MAPGRGDAKRSIFYGDPVEISEEDAAKGLESSEAAQEVVDQAVVEDAPDAQAAERLAAYDSMSRTERSEVTVIPPLSVSNAAIIVKPVTKGISANNLNYLTQKALVDYPALGKVKVATQASAGSDHFVVEFGPEDYPGEGSGEYGGFHAFPFFRFNLSASTLNARPGGNYSIYIVMKTQNGETIVTQPYTFQRIDSTQAVMGIMVPFRTIATRTLPALGIFGQSSSEDATTFQVHVTGMDTAGSEVFTVTHPGYSTAETEIISKMFSLPAGLNIV